MLPVECASCCQSSPDDKSRHLKRSDESGHIDPTAQSREDVGDQNRQPSIGNASNFARRQSDLASIEHHPLFKGTDHLQESNKFPYGRAHGETCASCTFTVPTTVAVQLPTGAPGSLPKDGSKSKYGAPVLRSKETVCLGNRKGRKATTQPGSSQESQMSSSGSLGSVASHTDCHDHTVTYLSAKSPDDPEDYAELRASVIRALSCEVLPRGMSEGPFCFGDSSTGYTIAYVFRLTDPEARGKRRAYAFVALAGKDADRAFKACPMLWEAFASMSRTIEQAAQRAQDDQELHQSYGWDDGKDSTKNQRPNYTEPSSFLTQRPRDNNGQLRRANHTKPRSLAEILGNDHIFPILHGFFVKVLRCLGHKFGGLPLAPGPIAESTTRVNEEATIEDKFPSRVSTDILATLQIDDDEMGEGTNPSISISRPAASVSSGTSTERQAVTSSELTPTTSASSNPVHRSPQCAPLSLDTARHRSVKV